MYKLIFKCIFNLFVFLITIISIPISGQIIFADSESIQLIQIETTSQLNESNFSVLLNKEISTSHQILSENLEKIPGVQSYNMGPGNGKTAIRGLSGNRIGIYVDGLRLDNQQWQDEHGLGFIAFDNDQQRVYFGPSNTIAGNEAMGGMISITQTLPIKIGTSQSITTGFSTNDLGYSIKYEKEVKKSTSSHWLNAYYGSHGDYYNGKNEPILNTRFDLIQFKIGSEKILKNNNKLMLNYRLSVSQTGIARISDSMELAEVKNSDSREFEGPNHLVALQFLSAKLSKTHQNGNSEFIGGLMSNTRIELEDYKMNGLAMQLNTLQMKHSRNWNKGLWKLEFCENFMLQTNKNFGNSVVVPNMNLMSLGLNSLMKRSIKSFTINFQFGLTEQIVATNSNKIVSFFAPNLTFTGTKYFNKKNEIGIRISKSYRAPNIHELFANGLSEDAFRYDIGNSKFNEESLAQIDANYLQKGKRHQLQISIFGGTLNHFISLNNTNRVQQGAPIFEYVANSGKICGGEFSLGINNTKKTWIFQNSLSITQIKTSEKNVAFSPPLKTKSNIIFDLSNENLGIPHLKINLEYIFVKIIQPYFEIDRIQPSYSLFNIYITQTFKKSDISIYAKNCFSTNYIDPMSMLKTIPYAATGFNLGLFFKYNF